MTRPDCPKCGHAMRLWETRKRNGDERYDWNCPKCYHTAPAKAHDWEAQRVEAAELKKAAAERYASERAELKVRQDACTHGSAVWENPHGWNCYQQKRCADCGLVVDVVDSSG